MTDEEETAYQKLWNKIRANIAMTAKDYVPQLYDLLIREGYPPKEARDKIKRDATNIWKAETIDKWIPQEAKQRIKILAGQKGAIAKTELEKPDSARSDLAEQDKDTNKDSSKEEDFNREPDSKEQTPFRDTEVFLQKQKDLDEANQLLEEERRKTKELNERIEQRDKRIDELDGLTNEQAYKMQELSRRVTEANTKVIDIDDNAGEVDKPTFEQHWNQLVDAECSFCHKITPLIIRHFISGKVVKWIDRDRYKEMYGMVPQQE